MTTMSPVLTQRVAGTSSGISRAVPNCQSQALRAGASVGSASRSSPTTSGSSPAGVRRALEQTVVPVAFASAVGNARLDDMDEVDAAPSSPSSATATSQPSMKFDVTASKASNAILASAGGSLDRPPLTQSSEPMLQPCGMAPNGQGHAAAAAATTASAPVVATFNTAVALRAPFQDDSGLLESTGDIPHDVQDGSATTFIPLMRAPAPPSPTHSSAPCSPASSIQLSSSACRSSIAFASYRLTSCSGIDSSTACAFATNASAASPSVGGGGGGDASCPLVNALLGPSDAYRQCFIADLGTPPSIQSRSSLPPPPQQLPSAAAHPHAQRPQVCSMQRAAAVSGTTAAGTLTAAPAGPQIDEEGERGAAAAAAIGAAAAVALLPLSMFAAASTSGCSSRRASLRDQNSVTIKATTVVKDAAGAIDKILSRGVTALVTALRTGGPPYTTTYDSLNQAVKAIAVARQYGKETGPEGAEVTFLPFHRYDSNERADPCRFAFLVFPVPHLDERLKTVDETVLNVARGSDVHKMASAIIAVMLDRGQAVMKAAGADAIFVAMSAVVNARHRLIQKHGFDLMLAAAWITEDTSSTMGRESKFLRFNVLKTEPAGPKSGVAPSLPAMMDA